MHKALWQTGKIACYIEIIARVVLFLRPGGTLWGIKQADVGPGIFGPKDYPPISRTHCAELRWISDGVERHVSVMVRLPGTSRPSKKKLVEEAPDLVTCQIAAGLTAMESSIRQSLNKLRCKPERQSDRR